ncbi:MAG: hypothetical protein A4E19_03735 [Nitrospira sp. SG-bin1]|nr:MAG: hypothetical protein A4E19_03735 [Nitrospira sp. SG-bin1]
MVGWSVAALVSAGQAGDRSEFTSSVAVPISSDGVQRAQITVDSYSFSPNHLVVESGKPVELTLMSVTTVTPHNFLIKDSAGGLSVEQDVGAGKTVTAKFVPTQPGHFLFFCDKRLWPMRNHRDKGMEGLLEVK